MQQIEDSYQLPSHMTAQFKNDGQPPRGISLMMPSADPSVQYTNLIPQVWKWTYNFINGIEHNYTTIESLSVNKSFSSYQKARHGNDFEVENILNYFDKEKMFKI